MTMYVFKICLVELIERGMHATTNRQNHKLCLCLGKTLHVAAFGTAHFSFSQYTLDQAKFFILKLHSTVSYT